MIWCRRLMTLVAAVLLAVVYPTWASAVTKAPTQKELRARLLTVSNLPIGWSVDNQPASGGETLFPCLASFEEPKDEHFVSVTTQFQDGPVPVFAERLTSSGSRVSGLFSSAVRALDRCRSVTLNGQHGSIGRMSFPLVGSASAAYAASFTYEGTPAGLDLIIFRLGIYEGLLVYVDAGTPKVGAVEALVDRAVAKIADALAPASP